MNLKFFFMAMMIIAGTAFSEIAVADIICDKGTKLFHSESCEEVAKIQKRHYSSFRTQPEAEARGYYPCQICMPPLAKDHEFAKVRRRHSLEINKTRNFVGDAKEKLCHHSWCPDVDNIEPDKKVMFNDIDDAWKRNYAPCTKCSPPVKPKRFEFKTEEPLVNMQEKKPEKNNEADDTSEEHGSE